MIMYFYSVHLWVNYGNLHFEQHQNYSSSLGTLIEIDHKPSNRNDLTDSIIPIFFHFRTVFFTTRKNKH